MNHVHRNLFDFRPNGFSFQSFVNDVCEERNDLICEKQFLKKELGSILDLTTVLSSNPIDDIVVTQEHEDNDNIMNDDNSNDYNVEDDDNFVVHDENKYTDVDIKVDQSNEYDVKIICNGDPHLRSFIINEIMMKIQ